MAKNTTARKPNKKSQKKTRKLREPSAAVPLQPAATHYNERQPRSYITDFVGISSDTNAEWITLAQAIRDIVVSEATPTVLYNSVMNFLNDHSSELWTDLMKSPEIIVRILTIAARKDEAAAEENQEVRDVS
jgi:hypothetical protein